jgi:hypothetical protein
MRSIRFNDTTIISVCDTPNQEVIVNGRIWRFDYDCWFGPLWLKKDGTERKCQNPNKAVWRAFENWQLLGNSEQFKK